MGFIGKMFGSGGAGAAADLYKKAGEKWEDFEVKSPAEMAAEAKKLFDSGLLTPEEFQAAMQDPSSLEQFTQDPSLRGAQMGSLNALTKLGQGGGQTHTTRARQNEIQNRNQTQARGAREANAMRSRQMGRGGSGMDQVANMIADQGAAQSNQMAGTQIAADAEMRALEGIVGAGNLAGNMSQADFARAQGKAQAADRINQFNTQNKNIAGMQGVADRNKAKDMSLAMQNQDWERKKQKLQGWTDATTGAAPYKQKQGEMMGEGISEFGKTAENMIGGGMFSDVNVKDDIAPAQSDLDDFLANLKPQKWDYTDPKYGATEGQENYGVMAQDMEKSPVGRSFVDEDAQGVKRIDYGKAQGAMMAILKDLSDRVGGLEGGR